MHRSHRVETLRTPSSLAKASCAALAGVVLYAQNALAQQPPSAGAGGAPANVAGAPDSGEKGVPPGGAGGAAEGGQKPGENDEEALKDLQAGTLMNFGLTGGVGAAIMGPWWGPSVNQKSFAVTGMPYIMALPAYWFTPQATREYCSSAWSLGNEDAAVKVAAKVAKQKAIRVFEATLSSLRAYRLTKGDKGSCLGSEWGRRACQKLAESSGLSGDDGIEFVSMVANYITDGIGRTTNDSPSKEQIIEWYATRDWQQGLAGRCGFKRIGAWIGLPLDYATNVKIAGTGVESREIKPTVAFGLGYTPNAYFSVLLGFSVGHMERNTEPGAVNRSANVWSPMLGVGGNLDLLGFLFKR